MKILIVDGDWRFASRAADALEARAHQVVFLPGPREALAHVDRWQPDVIILAGEFCQAQPALLPALHARTPRPAVLLTEFLDSYDRAWRTWQQGGDELLLKPVFSRRELHEAVAAARENSLAASLPAPAAASA